MNTSDLKLANFKNLVIKEAQEKRDAALEKISEEKNSRLSVIEKELQQAAQQKLRKEQAKILKEKNERIVQKQLAYRQELLSERQKIIDGIFSNVEKRLADYTCSSEYEQQLIGVVTGAEQRLEGALTAVISEGDSKHADKISALGLAVEYTDDNIIGGCFLIDKNNGIRIDETLSSKLEAAKDNFYNVGNYNF